jgi:hypothetical protein
MKFAKAYAAALTVLITVLVGKVGFDFDDEVTGALAVVLTPLVVAWVPNKGAVPS